MDDPQGPLKFIKIDNGRHRAIGHIHIRFDEIVHSEVGTKYCQNGGSNPCEALGYVKHWGSYFVSDLGLPVTANPDIAGPTGGFGWLFTLNAGAPKYLKLLYPEIDPTSPLVLGIPYPAGTQVQITAQAAWCNDCNAYSCQEIYHPVVSPDLVRSSDGNTFHMSSDGFLTVRIIHTPQNLGTPDWIFPQWDTPGKGGNWYAIDRFSRGGVTLIKLPKYCISDIVTELIILYCTNFLFVCSLYGKLFRYGPYIDISANCSTQADNAAYCEGTPALITPNVCASGYEQVAYDKCCRTSDPTDCVFA